MPVVGYQLGKKDVAEPVSRIFVGYNGALTLLSAKAMGIVAMAKGFVGPLVMVFLLPQLAGADEIWFSALASEILAMAVTIALLIWWRKKENSGNLPEADAEQGE